VPPLRERTEDIDVLVEHFTDKFLEEIPHLAPRRFSQEALEKLRQYRWPGNIRELRNVVERMLCSGAGEVVAPTDLSLEILPHSGPDESLPERVLAFERNLLLEALRSCKYNQKRSAERLGVTYDQFRHLYKKHKVKDILESET